MSLAVATLVQRIRFHLGDLPWETAGTAASTSSVIAVTDGTDWAEGDIMEIVDAVTGTTEIVRVSSISSNNVTGVRGYYGSTAAAHVTSSRILKNPKYKDTEITNAISSTIQGFLPWPWVYKVVADAITPDVTNAQWYDLGADALALTSVYQLAGEDSTQVMQYGRFHHYGRIVLKRNLPTSLVASGVGVAFPDGFLDASNTVYINYAAKITDTIATTSYSDFSDGDPVTEAIMYGTVALLQGSLELRKPRKGAQETDNLRSASYFNRIYHGALNQAANELRQKSPIMRLTEPQ